VHSNRTVVGNATFTVEVHEFLVVATNVSCMISYADYPTSTKIDPASTFKATRDGVSASLANCSIEKEMLLNVHGQPASEFRFFGLNQVGGKVYGRFLQVFKNPRLYTVGAMSSAQLELDSDEMNNYFGSFKIGE
jgi:hypothetical protein